MVVRLMLPDDIPLLVEWGKRFARLDYFSMSPTFGDLEKLVSRNSQGDFVNEIVSPHVHKIHVELHSEEIRDEIGMPLDYAFKIQEMLMFLDSYQRELASMWNNPSEYGDDEKMQFFRYYHEKGMRYRFKIR